MSSTSRDRFPPGFFDLPQGAAAALPFDIISEWTRSAQTAEIARRMLAPRTLRGIVACSDSSGLTRLGRERPLIDILAMIGLPKEIIHAHGRAIGGRPIGIWAADNTVMFYPSVISSERVLGMLVATARKVAVECELGIGLAAHTGSFYELGDALYGGDAERVEVAAEEYTASGELIVSDALVATLPATHAFELVPRTGAPMAGGGFLRLTNGPALTDIDATDVDYPAPYSSDFTTSLATYAHTRRDSRMPLKAYEDLAVVLIEREADAAETPEVSVLQNLALVAAMKRIGLSLLDSYANGREVKNVGLIAIYTFADCSSAIAFARDLRQSLAGQGIRTRIGIDAGLVLMFDLGGGGHDIAGSPVNVASKLAQDVGEYGLIQVSDEVARRANTKRERPTRTFTVSGVELRAYDV